MALRNIVLLTGLAVFMVACTTPPGSYSRDVGLYDDEYYYDYRSTPSYEGYYYVRIIFIRNVPYYVDDDRFIRPIPPRLYDHFRKYPYNTLGRPPVFSPDTEVRDGYSMSRIIYLDGVPYHVEKNRIAQPLPERLHQRFRYTPAIPGNAPANINRPQPFIQHDNGRINEPPVFEQDRGIGQNLGNHGPNGQNHERIEQPPIARGPREEGVGIPANPEGRPAPFPGPSGLPLRQNQPNVGESHIDDLNIQERGPNENRPQTFDSNNKAEKSKTGKNKSRSGKKNKKVKRSKAEDGKDH